MSTTTSNTFTHLVEYCETDAMRIVHHSEYIKWMEYARHHYFLAMGFNWAKLENETGIMMPILSVDIKYISMTRFGDTVDVFPIFEKFNGVYLNFSYEIRDHHTGELKATGKTRSGFVDRNFQPILLRDTAPDYFQILNQR